MKTARSRILLVAIGALSMELLSIDYTASSAFQNSRGQNKSAKTSIRCVLYTQKQEWEPSNPAVVYLAPITQEQLDQVELLLNQRPRKTLGFQTPASKLQASVASTI